jgi:hypothetical protein
MKWFKENGWSMHVIESKAVYNFEAGRYDHGQTEPGVSDSFGCAPDGTGSFVEFKAPGKRSTLKDHQRQFLMSKIARGAFAACVDSVRCLEDAWKEFEHRRKMDPQLAKAFLFRHLPKQKDEGEKLFPEEER